MSAGIPPQQSSNYNASTQSAPLGHASTQKGLLALVIGLGIIIIVATTALVVVLIKRMTYGTVPPSALSTQPDLPATSHAFPPVSSASKSVASQSGSASSVVWPEQAVLPLPSGSKITAVTAMTPEKLVIVVTDMHQENSLIIWNPVQGRVIQTILLHK